MVFADACHAGSLAARKPFGGQIQKLKDAYRSTRNSSAFILSSKSEEVSLEDKGLRQGIFSHFLIRGMKGECDDDGNGVVSISELFKFVQKGVSEYTDRAQNPQIQGDYDPHMPVSVKRVDS